MRASDSFDEIADAIVRLPLDVGEQDRPLEVFARSGYMTHRREITVDHLYRRLVADPALVDAWQEWVDDNRGYPAWYFTTRGPGEFEVGYIPFRGPIGPPRAFDDRARACAVYLHGEIEILADSVEIWSRPWRIIKETIVWIWEAFMNERDRSRAARRRRGR